MATYPLIFRPSFPYQDHLMHEQYVADINKGFTKSLNKAIHGSNSYNESLTSTIKENSQFIIDTISSNNELIENLTDTVEYGIEIVADGIAGLRSDFNIAMGGILSSFELTRKEIKEGFDKILFALENKRKIEAKEHFNDAVEFYINGYRFPDKIQWFKDSLKHFKASIDLYENNSLAHLYLGHIYHYQKEFQDFNKALEHYKLSFTYGEATIEEYPIAAQGYFYAGWLNAAILDDISGAIQFTSRSIELDGGLSESYYHLAKFYALNSEIKNALSNLRKAIVEFDKEYSIKALIDPDFNNIRDEVNHLLVSLKENAKTELFKIASKYNREFDPKDLFHKKKINTLWNELESHINDDTYFSFLDAFPVANRLGNSLSSAKKAKRENYERAMNDLETIENFLKKHICTDQETDGWARSRLDKAKRYLEKEDHRYHILSIDIIKDIWNRIEKIHWLTKLELNQIKITKKRKEEEKRRREEEKRRRENGLCLTCEKPLGLFQRIRKRLYCKIHS